MENASKALMIVGSVFLAILILTALILTFNKISDLKQVETDSEDEKKLLQYNKKIESFNKAGLYGSEILSLANLIDDYNIRQAELKGYRPISLEIKTKVISDSKYLKKDYTDYKKLINDFGDITDELNKLKNEEICGEILQKLAGMTTEDFRNLIDAYNKIHPSEKYTYKQIEDEIKKYQTINSEFLTFKNKKFGTPQIEYDNSTGKIISMKFKEVGI